MKLARGYVSHCPTPRYGAAAVVSSRGWPSDAATAALLDKGCGHQQALEVVLGVGLNTLSDSANHLAEAPLDRAFVPATWSKAA